MLFRKNWESARYSTGVRKWGLPVPALPPGSFPPRHSRTIGTVSPCLSALPARTPTERALAYLPGVVIVPTTPGTGPLAHSSCGICRQPVSETPIRATIARRIASGRWGQDSINRVRSGSSAVPERSQAGMARSVETGVFGPTGVLTICNESVIHSPPIRCAIPAPDLGSGSERIEGSSPSSRNDSPRIAAFHLRRPRCPD